METWIQSLALYTPCLLAHIRNPSTWEKEAEGSEVQSPPPPSYTTSWSVLRKKIVDKIGSNKRQSVEWLPLTFSQIDKIRGKDAYLFLFLPFSYFSLLPSYTAIFKSLVHCLLVHRLKQPNKTDPGEDKRHPMKRVSQYWPAGTGRA